METQEEKSTGYTGMGDNWRVIHIYIFRYGSQGREGGACISCIDKIELKNLSFQYGNGNYALKNVNMMIMGGFILI